MARRKKKRKYGTVLAFMSEPEVPETSDNLELASIWEIRPDPQQPRSLLPPVLAEKFELGEMTPSQIINAWFDTRNSTLEGLQRLAESIAQHGQINPISVRRAKPDESIPANVKYIIITGERRWWAHILLITEGRQIHEGQTTRSADQIKVSLTAEGVSIRAHQLIENLVREDLNVVEKAAGIWALRYELSNGTHGFGSSGQADMLNSLPNGTHGFGSSGQADGLDSAPNGTHGFGSSGQTDGLDSAPNGTHGVGSDSKLVTWQVVEQSLGISPQHRRRIINVLNLTQEARQLVRAHNLSERMIRPIVQKLSDQPALQIKTLKQLIAWQADNDDTKNRSLIRSVKEFVDQLLQPPPSEEPAPQEKAPQPVPSAQKVEPSAELKSKPVAPSRDEEPDASESAPFNTRPNGLEENIEVSPQNADLAPSVAKPEATLSDIPSQTTTEIFEIGKAMRSLLRQLEPLSQLPPDLQPVRKKLQERLLALQA